MNKRNNYTKESDEGDFLDDFELLCIAVLIITAIIGCVMHDFIVNIFGEKK